MIKIIPVKKHNSISLESIDILFSRSTSSIRNSGKTEIKSHEFKL